MRRGMILKENVEAESLAPQTDCRANHRCASVSEFERDRRSGEMGAAA